MSEQLGDAKPKGASAEKLASLVRFQYGAWPMPERAVRTSVSSLSSEPMASTSSLPFEQVPPTLARRGLEKEERCGICLCDYSDDDECMLGHCGHGFHDECLTSWLKEKGTCPYVHFRPIGPVSHTNAFPCPSNAQCVPLRPHEIARKRETLLDVRRDRFRTACLASRTYTPLASPLNASVSGFLFLVTIL